MSRRLSAALGTMALLFVMGLTVAAPASAAPSTVTVQMPKGAGLPSGAPGYAPENVTVVIGVNNTIVWTNNDTAAHTVTPKSQPVGGDWGTAGSGNIPAGSTYSFTFTVPGTYDYFCTYHTWMVGSVTVKVLATTSTSTTTSTTPEFPSAWLGAILLVVVVAAVLALSRLRPRPLVASPAT